MNIAIFLIASIVLAAIIHAGATGGPPDPASSRIESYFSSGGWFRELRLLAVLGLLLFIAGSIDRWWASVILAIPGGAALRFVILKTSRRQR